MSSANELSELANRACDGTLSAADLVRLEQLLREDPRNRPQYLRYVHLHALISWRFRTGPVPGEPQSGLAEPSAAQNSVQGFVSGASTRASWSLSALAQNLPHRRWTWGFTVAASLAILAIYWNSVAFDSKNSAVTSSSLVATKSKSVATLRESTHAVWTGRGRAIDVGSRVKAETLRVDAGEAELIFDSGAA